MVSKAPISLRQFCLLCAIVLYAVMGSPTPNHPGWIEGVLAVLFFLAAGFPAIIKTVHVSQSHSAWWSLLQIFWLMGLSISLIIGIANGAELLPIFRDMIGLIFLCLPLFLYPLFKEQEQRYLIFLLIFLAVIFCLRVVVPEGMVFPHSGELLYLANSPIVFFILLWSFGNCLMGFCQKFCIKDMPLFFLSLCLMGLCLSAMAQDIQRAAVLSLALTMVLIPLVCLVQRPLRALFGAMILAALLFTFHEQGIIFLQPFFEKTAQVGFNMRMQEIHAVWDMVRAHPFTILFGMGWGSTFPSPAVDFIEVTYTHSLLSYLLLKTGLLGLFLFGGVLVFLFEKILRLGLSDLVMANAFFWSLVIPVLFYASYKSLDFGLVLVALAAFSHKSRMVA